MIPSTQVHYFDDINIGDSIPSLTKGPLTSAHLMRWSAAFENWHKIHYDAPFAVEHDKLPALLVNGSLKQQFVVQLLKDWAGPEGWVWKASFQFRAMNLVNETLTAWATITGKTALQDYGLVTLELGIINTAGKESTPGRATIALPFRGGKAVPYPFVAPKL
jgi:acyl dehydratase